MSFGILHGQFSFIQQTSTCTTASFSSTKISRRAFIRPDDAAIPHPWTTAFSLLWMWSVQVCYMYYLLSCQLPYRVTTHPFLDLSTTSQYMQPRIFCIRTTFAVPYNYTQVDYAGKAELRMHTRLQHPRASEGHHSFHFRGLDPGDRAFPFRSGDTISQKDITVREEKREIAFECIRVLCTIP